MASAAASQRRELPPVAVDECGSPKAWCRGGGSEGPAKFGREALGGGAHRRLGSVVVSVHNPTQDDGLRHWGVETWHQEVDGRQRLASEGVGLCEKRRGKMGGAGSSFWTEQRKQWKGGPGLMRYMEGKGRGSGGVARA
jgi:hypothetical protein